MYQYQALLSDPAVSGMIAVVGFVLVLVIVKFVFGKKLTKKTPESFQASTRAEKKRKAKKQKNVTQEKITSNSSKSRKTDNKNSNASSLVETSKPVIEEKNDKRKDAGKSKSKSKKKKIISAAKNEIVQESFVKEQNFEDSGWKTVSTKEQREQIKREKRKLDETATALSKEPIIEKTEPVPLVQPHKPIHNPAIAKGIAPRFARAAGTEWQEKPTANQLLQSKRPMPPATVPGTTKPQVEQNTVTQQTWNQGNPTWHENLGWPTPSTLPSTLMSYHPSDPTHLLSMAQSSGKNSPDSWPQGGVSWQSSGSRNSNSSWEVNGDDWVHVAGTNNKIESWQPSEVKSQVKDDVWIFEPEGFPLQDQQVDCDPWGMDTTESDTGDWSAPTASWGNVNAEWTAPSPTKLQPTYIDESSADEAAPLKTSANPTQQESQPVVGISQESSNQKKSRRRRKKKNSAPEQTLPPPESEVALSKPEVQKVEESVPEPKPVEVVEDWSVSKASKKRRVKPRKVD